MIAFHVNAVPVPQPRQRHRVVTSNGRTFATNYTPKGASVNVFKACVRMALESAYRGAPIEGPIYLTVIFLLPRPGRLIWKTRPMPRVPHIGKPDTDNLVKSLKDALSGLAWRDDAQVFNLTAVKWYASGDEAPGVDVSIHHLESKE